MTRGHLQSRRFHFSELPVSEIEQFASLFRSCVALRGSSTIWIYLSGHQTIGALLSWHTDTVQALNQDVQRWRFWAEAERKQSHGASGSAVLGMPSELSEHHDLWIFYGDKLQHVATQLQFCKPVRLRLPRQLKLVIPPISVPLLTISGPLDRGIPFGAICALVLIGSLWFLTSQWGSRWGGLSPVVKKPTGPKLLLLFLLCLHGIAAHSYSRRAGLWPMRHFGVSELFKS